MASSFRNLSSITSICIIATCDVTSSSKFHIQPLSRAHRHRIAYYITVINIKLYCLWSRPGQRQRDRERQRETERDRERQRETERDRERQRETERHTEKHRETQRDTQTHRSTYTERQRGREAERQTERQREIVELYNNHATLCLQMATCKDTWKLVGNAVL